MSDISHNLSHVAEALSDRLFQDKNLPRLTAFISALAVRWQAVEDFFWALATERDLDVAIGVQLDGLGDILDEPRGGLNDDQYRLFLRAKVLVLRSRGRIEELIQILVVLGYTEIVVFEQPPAHVQIEVCDVGLVHETDRVLRLAKAGGVGLLFVYGRKTAAEVFQASGTYAIEEYDSLTGAGSVYDATVGGQSAGGFR